MERRVGQTNNSKRLLIAHPVSANVAQPRSDRRTDRRPRARFAPARPALAVVHTGTRRHDGALGFAFFTPHEGRVYNVREASFSTSRSHFRLRAPVPRAVYASPLRGAYA
jgi:hypothetical protein